MQRVHGWEESQTSGKRKHLGGLVFFELLQKRGFRDWDGSPGPSFYLSVWFKFYMKPLKSSRRILQLLWHSHTSHPSTQAPAHKDLQTHQVRLPNASYPYHGTAGSYGNQFFLWFPKQLHQKGENILQLSSYRNIFYLLFSTQKNLPAVRRCWSQETLILKIFSALYKPFSREFEIFQNKPTETQELILDILPFHHMSPTFKSLQHLWIAGCLLINCHTEDANAGENICSSLSKPV